MLVKAIMIPANQLQCISVDNNLKEALHIIDSNRLLSLPVVDGKQFVGVLSKQFVYETYFRNFEGSKEEFLKKKVSEMIKTEIMTISKDTPIEDAASIFITSKIRFIPITDDKNQLLGIVTHQAIFKEYQKIFGNSDENVVTIYCHNFKGALSNIAKIIAKNDGNIKNIVQKDTDVMGLQEVFIRIEGEQFDTIVKELIKKGYDARKKKQKD